MDNLLKDIYINDLEDIEAFEDEVDLGLLEDDNEDWEDELDRSCYDF